MNDQLQQIEISIDVAKERIQKMNDIIKLSNNKEFKAVFTDGYFESEPIRLVMLKADPSQTGDAEQKEIMKMIDAIGYLRLHLHAMVQLGRQAEKALYDDQQTREELLQEEAVA